MKRKYLRLFVCRQLLLVILLCFYAAKALAQPACATVEKGVISAGDVSNVCPGNMLQFTLNGSTPDNSILFFLQRTESLSDPFIVSAAPVDDPANTPIVTAAFEGTSYYRIAAMCKYNGVYTPVSDTLIVTTRKSMSGTYYINSSLSPDARTFTSFTAAVEELKNSCITGPVVFDVTTQGATYKEQLTIPQLNGVSAVNTITFNGNGNTISYNGTGYYDNRSIIKLDGADYIIIDSLNINATTGQSGIGVSLTNDADNNIIRHCTINAGVNSNTSGYMGILISGSPDSEGWSGSNCDDNVFDGNTIIGGFTAISITGQADRNQIINNDIRDMQQKGIVMSGTRETIISGNKISRPKRTVLWPAYGMELDSDNYSTVISDNRIFNLSGGDKGYNGALYGIYFSSCDADISSPNRVFNNLFYNFNGVGPACALYNGSSDYVYYYHNTISFDNSVTQTVNQPTAGLYLNTEVDGVEFKNNIVSIQRGGAGMKYGIYKRTEAIGCSSDYNDIFLLPDPSIFVGFTGTSQQTLAAWQNKTGGDLATVLMDPMFLNAKEGNYKPNNQQLDNKGTSVGVTEDFDITARDGVTPDVGAYEFAYLVCSNPPMAGTVVIAQNTVCSAASASLSLTGGELGDGLTYQWQSSADGSTWTNIAAATAKETVVSQTTDTWYRMVTTCGTGSTPSDKVQIKTQNAISGKYTINKAAATGGQNFQSFADAWNAVKCGITGPVEFSVVPGSGPYFEQLITSPVPGMSAVNTITFLGNGNTLEFESDNAFERATVKLNGTDHLIIDSLVIKASATGTGRYAYGVQLTNDADSNIIRRCTIYSDTAMGLYDWGYTAIAVNGPGNINPNFGDANSDDNLFEKNTVVGGYYGITIAGSTTAPNRRNVIRGNNFVNFLSAGVYSAFGALTVIDSNYFSRPTRTGVGAFKGIYLTGSQSANTISRNHIFNAFGGDPSSTEDFYGIQLDNADASSGAVNTISNNVIYNTNGAGAVYGLYNMSSDFAWYYHNTVHIDGDGSYESYGLYQTSQAIGLLFRDNIVTVNRSGDGKKYALYLGATGSVFVSDYNNFFIQKNATNGIVGYVAGADRKSVANIQLNGNDGHSTSVDPAYKNLEAGNLQPKNGAIDNAGLPVAVAVDVNGVARNATHPDIGAYEFTADPCTSPVTTGTAVPSAIEICEGTKIELNLDGNSIGGGQTYQWEASATATGTFGAVSASQQTPTYYFTPDVNTVYYRAAVTCNGVTAYTEPITFAVDAMLPGGVYTIDQNGTGNFKSFNEAKAAMACGIKGPVVFNVLPGGMAYKEQLLLDSIVGASAINTVTFKGNGDTILYSSTDYDAPAVIAMQKTDYVTFDSLVISAMGTGYVGVGVWIGNQASNNTFRKCTILIPQTSSSSSYNGVVVGPDAGSGATSYSYTQGFYNANNLFERNIISGGYCGMSMQGSIYGAVSNNRFIGNTIRDVYSYGIYTCASVFPVIDSNTISRPTRKSITTFYGIYANGYAAYPVSVNNGLRINGNRIHTNAGGAPTSTSNAYGIYLTGTTAASLMPATVSNNLIYNFNGAGTLYGIANSNSGTVRYYHNTISFDNKNNTGTTAAYGIHMSSAASGLDIKNNIVSVTRSGTGARYAMYFPSSANFTSDYNNLWVEQGTNRFIGYFGAAKTTMADWQGIALANTDKHSVSMYPSYEDSAKGKYNSVLTQLDNTGTPVGITADINKQIRSTVTPDMGAYESTTGVCTSPPVAGTSSVTPSALSCMGGTVTLTLTGNSTGGNQKYVWQRAVAEAGPWVSITDSLALPDYTYQVNEKQSYFRAAVVCGTGVTYSNAVPLTVSGGLDAGDYTIDPSLPAGNRNFLSFNEAVSAMLCGINGSIRVLVAPGVYEERVRVPRIPGTAAGTTVTFQSRENSAASVFITDSCKIDSNYVVKLDTTSYIIFKNLTIKPVGSDYATAVVITGGSASDSITGCTIPLPAVQTTAENVVGIYGKELLGSKLVVSKNTITGGMSGIFLEGAEPFAQDFVLDSNNVSGGYLYSVYGKNLMRVSASGNTIARSGIQNIYNYGIYLQKCDSVTHVDKNNITITNTATACSAIQVFWNAGSANAKGTVSGNMIHADATNTGDIYGLRASTAAANFNAMNNVVAIATSGNAYGIYSVGTNGGTNYYNNSVLIESKSEASAAAFVSDGNDKDGGTGLYNNVLANTGGGVAMYMFNPLTNRSDYNMYYSSGAALITTKSGNIATLKDWQDLSNWDYSSIVYKPTFADNVTLKPDAAKPEVWAMHGRGVQIAADNADINGQKRPVTLETGVPDLGAYEFTPTTVPVALTAIPATPVANKVQTFMLGTDTVLQVSWGSTVPSTIEGKRYSGVSPEGLQTGQQFMYFYTAFTYTGTAPKDFGIKQFYIDSWRGLIPRESMIKLGKTNSASGWDISARSRLDTAANTTTDVGIALISKFTGLTDGRDAATNPVVISFRDSSNRGTMFWVPYSNTQSFTANNNQDMLIYLGAGEKEAHVTVRVNGTNWMKKYTVPPFTAITTDAIPKTGLFDARLLKEGWSDRGVSIQSDVPVSAYAHIYNQYISGATMLMPVGTYGYEYYALTGRQTYGSNRNASVVSVVAAYDSTVVEITPSVKTQGNRQPGVPFTVSLKKGEVYQLIGAIDDIVGESYDLTGTKIRSIKNANDKCWPVAVFSGSNLTGFGCSLTGNGGTGDNLFQQNFPYQAWGKRYLTAPLSHNSSAAIPLSSLYRVSVKDASTIVQRNGVPLTDLQNNSYYEFVSNTADYITADRPIMVAQFETSAEMPACGNPDKVGDPEMFFLSPVEQGVKETQLYRNTSYRITVQYLTLVVPTKGLSSLTIDGSNSWDIDYPHPNKPGYSVVVVRWEAEKKQAFVKCDSAFTGITYGMGEFESYGYNAGTNVFNLNTRVALSNTHTSGASSNDYTCAGTPFKLSLVTTVEPTAIDWALSQLPYVTPAADIHVNNPKAAETFVVNGITYYKYVLDKDVTVDTSGEFYMSAFITHPDIDACDSRQETRFPVTVLNAPVVDFTSVGICAGSEIQFTGSSELESGSTVSSWTWDFNDAGAGSHQKDTVHTYKQAGDYNVKLSVVYANGCIGDTVKVVNIKAPLPAPAVKKGVITAYTVQFTWDAIPGATGYEISMDNGATWVTPSTGNMGLSHTVTGLQLAQTVTIKVRVLGSCLPAESAPLSATTMVQEVFVPNSFSPDNSGPAENETFRIYGNSIKQLRLMVFNQWGEKVFESNNQANGWDGRYKGKPQPSGVYIYVADVLMENGIRETKKGTINLIR